MLRVRPGRRSGTNVRFYSRALTPEQVGLLRESALLGYYWDLQIPRGKRSFIGLGRCTKIQARRSRSPSSPLFPYSAKVSFRLDDGLMSPS